MSWRQILARLGLIDVAMLAGIAAGAVWLVLTHFTAIEPTAALMLAGLAAVAAFSALHKRLRHTPGPRHTALSGDRAPTGEQTSRE
ncbi:hypothetical protein [Spirillospora sp. CA-128828]|uniref:hypothetical protein n=1 Tax=Spirillospora sp. CA-128828 TaxID=3240033 RepID=UPI003D8FE014